MLNVGGTNAPFCCLAINTQPDVNFFGQGGQFFCRWRYEDVAEEGTLDFGLPGEVVNGFRRFDNITDTSLFIFQKAYGSGITKDDIFAYVYGLLHSADYRSKYAADLKKMLPRIPLVDDLKPFVRAGRALFDLHLSYETVEPIPARWHELVAVWRSVRILSSRENGVPQGPRQRQTRS